MKRLFFVFIDVVIAGNDIDRCDAVTVFQSLEDDALAGSCLLAGDLAGLCLDGDALFGYTDEFIIVISGYESDDFGHRVRFFPGDGMRRTCFSSHCRQRKS